MSQKTLIPLAIIVAGLLIAGAVFMSNKQQNPATGTASVPTDLFATTEVNLEVSPINETDYIRGSFDAELTILEFSDLECPFCKKHQLTLQNLTNEYEDTELAWVYRQFPITQLHSKAYIESVGQECAGALGGNDAFWTFTDKIYEITPSNNGLDLDLLPQTAEEIGLDRVAFEECLSDEKWQAEIEKDMNDAVTSAEHIGGSVGTPYNILISQNEFNDQTLELIRSLAAQYNKQNQIIFTISKDHKRIGLSGALPIEMLQGIVNTALEKTSE